MGASEGAEQNAQCQEVAVLFGASTSVDWRAVYPLIAANVASRRLFKAIRSV